MIIVTGENVVDLVPTSDGTLRPLLGGGPANTAVVVARLGTPVAFVARFGSDVFGSAFRNRLTEAGVDLRYAVEVAAPSALALATLDATGSARYDFWLTGAADFGTADVGTVDIGTVDIGTGDIGDGIGLPRPADGDVLYAGSLAAYWPPGADAIERWLDAHRDRCAVAIDLNLRVIVTSTQPDARDRLERLVRLAHVVKASDDDLLLAYPDRAPDDVARGWLRVGPSLVVLTRGALGATAFTEDHEVAVPAPAVTVVDTIGAGDAAMGALLHAIHEGRLRDSGRPRQDGRTRDAGRRLDDHPLARRERRRGDLESVLRYVCAAGSLACARPGAYAPTREEITRSGV